MSGTIVAGGSSVSSSAIGTGRSSNSGVAIGATVTVDAGVNCVSGVGIMRAIVGGAGGVVGVGIRSSSALVVFGVTVVGDGVLDLVDDVRHADG